MMAHTVHCTMHRIKRPRRTCLTRLEQTAPDLTGKLCHYRWQLPNRQKHASGTAYNRHRKGNGHSPTSPGSPDTHACISCSSSSPLRPRACRRYSDARRMDIWTSPCGQAVLVAVVVPVAVGTIASNSHHARGLSSEIQLTVFHGAK
jgi:hypothetical protein